MPGLFFYLVDALEGRVKDESVVVFGEEYIAAPAKDVERLFQEMLFAEVHNLFRPFQLDELTTGDLHFEGVVVKQGVVLKNLHDGSFLEHIAHLDVDVGHAVVVAFVERNGPVD